MKLKQISLMLLSLTAIGSAQATYHQHIRTCLSVVNNQSGYTFRSGFKSDDFFTRARFTGFTNGQEQCVGHVYKKGPKRIKLAVETLSARDKDIRIDLGPGCAYMFGTSYGEVGSSYQKTSSPHETWHFTLTEQPSIPGTPATYVLNCSYQNQH